MTNGKERLLTDYVSSLDFGINGRKLISGLLTFSKMLGLKIETAYCPKRLDSILTETYVFNNRWIVSTLSEEGLIKEILINDEALDDGFIVTRISARGERSDFMDKLRRIKLTPLETITGQTPFRNELVTESSSLLSHPRNIYGESWNLDLGKLHLGSDEFVDKFEKRKDVAEFSSESYLLGFESTDVKCPGKIGFLVIDIKHIVSPSSGQKLSVTIYSHSRYRPASNIIDSIMTQIKEQLDPEGKSSEPPSSELPTEVCILKPALTDRKNTGNIFPPHLQDPDLLPQKPKSLSLKVREEGSSIPTLSELWVNFKKWLKLQ